jgi:hypothetical protein
MEARMNEETMLQQIDAIRESAAQSVLAAKGAGWYTSSFKNLFATNKIRHGSRDKIREYLRSRAGEWVLPRDVAAHLGIYDGTAREHLHQIKQMGQVDVEKRDVDHHPVPVYHFKWREGK